MPLLGFFRKDKRESPRAPQISSSTVSRTDEQPESPDTDFVVLSTPAASVPSLTNAAYPYINARLNATQISIQTASKFKSPFRRKARPPTPAAKPTANPPASPPDSPRKLTRPRQSIDRLTVGTADSIFHPPPRRSSLFNNLDNPPQSLPKQDKAFLSPPKSVGHSHDDRPSQGGFSSWHGERPLAKPSFKSTSTSTPQSPQTRSVTPSDSFNLKSFRHIRPTSPMNSPDLGMPPSPSSSFPSPLPRPRGGSVASDTSQRISVAAFREAQARRSSTNVANMLSSPSNRSSSAIDSAGVDASSPSRTVAPRLLAVSKGLPPPPPSSAPVNRTSSQIVSSSESESSYEEESDSDTAKVPPSRKTIAPGRATMHRSTHSKSDVGHGYMARVSHHQQTTSTRSELGHDQPQSQAPSDAKEAFTGTRSLSLYKRQRGSYSTSELEPSAAAKRASVLAAVNAEPSAPVPKAESPRHSSSSSDSSGSGSSDSSSGDDDDDDAPLASLVLPNRPGTAASNSSTPSPTTRLRTFSKPLIDLNAKFNAFTGKPMPAEEMPKETQKFHSPTNINARLQQLTAGLSTQNLNTSGTFGETANRENVSKPIAVEKPTPSPPPISSSPETIQGRPSRQLSFDRRSASLPHIGVSPDTAINEAGEANEMNPWPVHVVQSGTATGARNGFEVVSRPTQSRSPESMGSSSVSPPPLPASVEAAPSSSSTAQIRPTAIRHRPTSSSFSVVSRPPSTASHYTLSAQAPLQRAVSPPQGTSHVPRKPSADEQAFASPHSSTSSPSVPQKMSHNGSSQPPRKPSTSTTYSTSSSSTTTHAPRKLSADEKAFTTSPSSISPPSLPKLSTQPLERPFAAMSRRQESPESSVGGSSTSRAPLTPGDGSDYFSHDPRWRSNSSSAGTSESSAAQQSAMKKVITGHRKSSSVTFQNSSETVKEAEKERERMRPPAKSSTPAPAAVPKRSDKEMEPIRRERRRSEAKAAIELGNAVNGHGPSTDEDDDEDMPINSGMGPRMQMVNPMLRGGMMHNFGTPPPSSWDAWSTPVNNMPILSPQQFMIPPPPMNADPSYMAAHQQAMMIAKQTYQFAIAQQALNAANEEWERSSNMTSFGGGIGMSVGSMTPGGSMSSGWMPGGGGSPFFPPPARSMYAGGYGGGSDVGRGWDTATAYGEPFGPSFGDRRSQMFGGGGGGQVPFPPGGYSRSGSMADTTGNGGVPSPTTRPNMRTRTKTAPSNAPLPTQHSKHGKGMAPPSSWRT